MDTFIQTQGTQVAFLLRGISLFICLVFVLPLVIKNSLIRNGLFNIRILLLIYGVIGLILNFQVMLALFDILINHIPQRPQNLFLQSSNAFYVLVQTLIIYGIYHYNFTDESIEMHKKHAEEEEAKQQN